MDHHLGGVAGFGMPGREGRNVLDHLQNTLVGGVFEDRDGVAQLVDHVGELAIGAESEVPGTGSRGDLGEGGLVAGECPGLRVEGVDQHLVEAEIGGEGEPIGGIEIDRVRVRFFLPLRIDAVPLVGDHAGGRPQLAACDNRERGDAPATVVGHQHMPPGGVHIQVAGPRSARQFGVQHGQSIGGGVALQGGHPPTRFALGVVDFRHRVQQRRVLRMHRQERGILQLDRQLGSRELARRQVERRGVDPFRLGSGVGANVEPQRGGVGGLSTGAHQCAAQQAQRHPTAGRQQTGHGRIH